MTTQHDESQQRPNIQGRKCMKTVVLMTRILSACALIIAAGPAFAQDWPQKPIRVLVAFGAGSPPDIVSRVLAEKMGALLGRPMFVENKPGAIGIVAMNELLKNPADGYTVLNMITPILVAPTLLKEPKLDPIRDLAPVGQFTWSYSVLVTGPSAEATGVKQLADSVRARPRQFSFASGGHGTPAHLAGELFNQSYNLDAVHVPYNQFPLAIADLTSGRVNFMFLTSTVAVPNVLSGKLRALGVASERRLPQLPNVATLAEQGFTDFDVRTWDGFVVKAGTPAAIIERLNRALNTAVQMPDVKERWTNLGLDIATGTPAQYGEVIRRDSERWLDVVRKRNIKVD